METIPKNNCAKIGYVQKPHGIHGELIIRFDEEFYETLEEQPVLLLDADSLLVPFFISDDGLRFKSGESVIVKLDWIDNEEQAKKLCGLQVFVDRNDVVEPEDGIVLSPLIGYLLIDKTLGTIGNITDMHDYSGNLLISVEYQGVEELVPLNEELIISIDDTLQEIVMDLPEGLFGLGNE